MKTIVLSALILLVSITINAQELKSLTDMPAQWKYHDENSSGEWYDQEYYKLNPAELNEYQLFTQKLASYFGTQGIIHDLRGVNLNAHARSFYNHYDHELFPVKATEWVKANLFIEFCSIYEKNGKAEDACMEVPYIDIKSNYPEATYETAFKVDADDANTEAGRNMAAMFYLPKTLHDLGERVYLYDNYYDNVIVVARNSRPYWIPVTTKQYIDWSLAYHEMILKKQGSYYQMVMEQVKKEIAMVPPSLMYEAVYVSNLMEDRYLLGICRKDEKGAMPVYRFNPEYFDLSLPRTTVQLITISIPGHLDDLNLETENDRISVLKYIQSLNSLELKKLLHSN